MPKRGGQTTKPRRVTITIPEVYGEELDRLAQESGVTVSALCANIVTRYAMQDRTLLANDIISERLERQLEKQLNQFDKRVGDLLAVTALHTIAHRRQDLIVLRSELSDEDLKKVQDAGWSYAVKTLRKYGREEPTE